MQYDVTNSELEILRAMWKAGRPLSRAEILSAQDRSWHDNSVHILLNSMLKKELITSADFVRSGKVWARTYEPTFSAHDFYVEYFEAYGWPDPIEFVQWIVEQKDVSRETIDKLIEVIQQKRASVKTVAGD